MDSVSGKKTFGVAPSSTARLLRAAERLVFSVALLTLAGILFFHRDSLTPLLYPTIRDVQLQGRFVHIERLHADELVRNSIGEYFFGIDLHAVKRRIENLPWVKSVSVTRIWPYTLNVTIEEHRAEARWGEDALISSEAVVFNPPGAGGEQLPVLYAGTGMEAMALARYREARELLAAAGLARIMALGEDASGAWGLLLDNGVFVRIGDIHWHRRLKRFVTAWQSGLNRKADQVRYVDLRYPDGFVVAWRDGMGGQSDEDQI